MRLGQADLDPRKGRVIQRHQGSICQQGGDFDLGFFGSFETFSSKPDSGDWGPRTSACVCSPSRKTRPRCLDIWRGTRKQQPWVSAATSRRISLRRRRSRHHNQRGRNHTHSHQANRGGDLDNMATGRDSRRSRRKRHQNRATNCNPLHQEAWAPGRSQYRGGR